MPSLPIQSSDLTIRDAEPTDVTEIARIYNWYVENTPITFEEQQVSEVVMGQRLGAARHPWLVLAHRGRVLGFAYAGTFRSRSAYRFTAETTIYLARDAQGKGLGTYLYESLIDRLRDTPAHLLMAIIALPNEKSIGLHEKLGFEKTGHLKQVGRKFDRWIDVGYWQLTLSSDSPDQSEAG